jgi:ABC-2 type transport system permease protein
MPIFDQGYQHWKGTLSGHAWRWLAITRHGIRGQLKGRLVRGLLFAAWAPALVLVILLALWGLIEQGTGDLRDMLKPILPPGLTADPHDYRMAVWTIAYSAFFRFETFFCMLLVVVAGPNLISHDLRFNALPLYFSRPLTRLDYFLGKLGVIAALVAAVAVVPAVVAYALGVVFSLDLSVIRDTWRLLPASFLYGVIIVVSAGTLMLALSSLSRRSLYVGVAWVGLWLISSTVAGVLGGVHQGMLYQQIAKEQKDELRAMSAPDTNAAGPRQPPRGGAAQRRYWQNMQERVERAEAKAAPTNWRPLCSYTANLQRLGDALLNADAAYVQFGKAIAAPQAALAPLMAGRGGPLAAESAASIERSLADKFVLQYPWIWSASVLAALWGISLWTLSMRVKSLDQLR